uniref:Uncharacterized protein n=1 Tax=Arundo donax TaxID=35708 RepID=A0A0A9HTF9_ARUDO
MHMEARRPDLAKWTGGEALDVGPQLIVQPGALRHSRRRGCDGAPRRRPPPSAAS